MKPNQKITLLPKKEAKETRRLHEITYDMTEQKGRVHIACRVCYFVPKMNRVDTKYYYLSPSSVWTPLWDYDYNDPKNGFANRETAQAYMMKLLTTPLSR